MKKLERFLTLEVKQRVQDMQAGKEGIPVGEPLRTERLVANCLSLHRKMQSPGS